MLLSGVDLLRHKMFSLKFRLNNHYNVRLGKLLSPKVYCFYMFDNGRKDGQTDGHTDK